LLEREQVDTVALQFEVEFVHLVVRLDHPPGGLFVVCVQRLQRVPQPVGDELCEIEHVVPQRRQSFSVALS